MKRHNLTRLLKHTIHINVKRSVIRQRVASPSTSSQFSCFVTVFNDLYSEGMTCRLRRRWLNLISSPLCSHQLPSSHKTTRNSQPSAPGWVVARDRCHSSLHTRRLTTGQRWLSDNLGYWFKHGPLGVRLRLEVTFRHNFNAGFHKRIPLFQI